MTAGLPVSRPVAPPGRRPHRPGEHAVRRGLPVGPAPVGPPPVGSCPVDHPTHPGLPPAAERPSGPWAPWSPCGPECLPPPARPARLRTARRLAALVAVVGVALPLLTLCGARGGLRRGVFRAVLVAAGIRLRVVGDDRFAPGDCRGVLVVANHLSWVDVLALGAVQPVQMIAKREVRDWPVVGSVAERAGVLFVDRGGLHGLPAVVDAAAAALRGGAAVGVFPEGTTWCGSASGPFRRAVFQAALDAGAPVRPVTIDLRLPDGRPTTAGAFVGDSTLLDSLRRVLALDALVCEVTVHPPLHAAAGEDRRLLARRAETAVTAA